MEVVIVDDEPAARRTVRECCEREPDLRVIGEFGDPRAALEAIRSQHPQVLFLDIQMDSMTGMALARALDPERLPLIVFVTAYDHYALEAFEVSAVDYLLKPFDDARFRATMARVRRRHNAEGSFDRQAALASLLEQLARHNAKEEPILYPQTDLVLTTAAGADLRAFLAAGRMPYPWVCAQAGAGPGTAVGVSP